ncbi:hypothetical protein BaRGS_00039471, partial [Batillaria attramentaria]
FASLYMQREICQSLAGRELLKKVSNQRLSSGKDCPGSPLTPLMRLVAIAKPPRAVIFWG